VNYLQVEGLTKYYGEKRLFEGLSFAINEGDKVAFVAKNGTGKSSMLRIILGLEPPTEGIVQLNKKIRVGFLEQEPELNPDLSVMDEVFLSDNPMLEAIREYEDCLEHPDDRYRMEEAFRKMDASNAWEYETRIKQILGQLKIHDLSQPTTALSGGQKKRVAQAKELILEPQFLILDEPTNHLDLEMIEWLEQYLERNNITLLMVTHDRYFLDRVCNTILEIDHGELHKYKGNYSYYLEKRAERYEVQKANQEKAQNIMCKELEWIRRSPSARGTKAKARVDAFQDVKEAARKKVKEEKVEIQVNMERLGSKILELHNVSKSYGEKNLFTGFDYKFKRKDRVGVTGKNGTGKTTFLRMITGDVSPDTGKVVIGETVKFGHFSQEGLHLKEDLRVIEAVREIADVIPMAKGKKLTAEQLLERFLFDRKEQQNYVRKLSGGEKRRLQLCIVLMKNPNFLILDEPTNDLDILTLNVLEDFLQQYEGCLLIVSHDRYFMDKLVDHLFVFEGDGHVADFPGNYSQYRLSRKREESVEKKEEKTIKENLEKKEEPPKQRKLTYMEQKEFKELDKDIKSIEVKLKELEHKMSSGNLDNEEMVKLANDFGALKDELDEKELRWLELSEYA
jgi:ATP-binding cassette subfamily F protein uup